METKRICPSCQKTLPPNVPLGLCPECLIKSGFPTSTDPENPGKEAGFVPPPVEEIAKLFPQLEIIELIGKGGMGAVYKARQPTLDRFVALKILPPGVADDAGFAERFNREARALARLNHPRIVAVHDFGQAGGQPYLVMEFVDGLNLRQVEQAGRLSPEQALEIVPQICEALQFAHNEGVVHRDIKPENILLDTKGRVKITDFGIAKILGKAGDLTLTGAKDVMGTPHYMAPEQVEQPAKVDHRADIYSLGVVFYEMLTGELPLGKFAPPSRKVHVDVRLDEVVLHALEKEPELRYQQARELKTDVETIAGTPAAGAATTAAPPDAAACAAAVSRACGRAQLSRLAVFGAVWAPFVVFPLLVLFVYRVLLAGTPPRPEWWQTLLMAALLPLGMMAPVGTTILGWVAISQIRHSRGRLYGLGLAVLDALLFPLLALDALIAILFRFLGAAIVPGFGFPHDARLSVLLGSMVICLVGVDWLIIRAVLRAANRSPADSPSASAAVATVRVVNKIAWSIFGLLMLMSAVVDFNRDRFSELTRMNLNVATVLSLACAATLFAIYLINYRFRVSRDEREEVPHPLTPATATQTPVNVENVRRQVSAPAIGLVVTGILNWIGISLIVMITAAFVGGKDLDKSLLIWVPLAALVFSSVMIVAGLKMKRLESYGLGIAGSVLTMLVTPGNVIGLPIGIWALVVLSHREVREAFAKGGSLPAEANAGAAPPMPRPDRFWKRFAVAIVLILLAIFVIPVGAILLGIALPALNRAKVKMQSKSEPAQLSMTFGPAIERIVNDLDENRGDEALNFRTGRLLSLPVDFEQRREAWLNANGVDLLVDFARDRWALMSRGMEFRDVGNEQWRNTSTIEFGGAWPGSQMLEKREGRGGTFYLLPTNAQLPMSFAFLTSNGDQGVLQITGFADNPRGVKMHYKLMTPSGGGGSGGRTFQGDHGNDAAMLTQEGWQLWQGGRPADAIPKFESAVKLDPKNSAAWNGLGWASFNSGKTAEAEKAFQKVIELEPDHSAALNGIGQIYLAQKKYAEAESYLLKASSKAPAAWYGLARLYLLQGKFAEAEKWAQKVVDSGQADEGARLMLQAARDKKVSEGLRLMIEPQ